MTTFFWVFYRFILLCLYSCSLAPLSVPLRILSVPHLSSQQISHKEASNKDVPSCKRPRYLRSSVSDEGESSQDKRKEIARPQSNAMVDLKDIRRHSIYTENPNRLNVDQGSPKPIPKTKKEKKADRYRSKPPKIEGNGSSGTIDKFGYTKLHRAVISVNKKAVENILNTTPVEELKKLINQKDSQGYAPLHWCLDGDTLAKLNPSQKEDYLSIFKLLLHYPICDVAIPDKCGRHILHWAVIGKYVEAVKAIFDKARDSNSVKGLINRMDCFGYAPLHYLVEHDSLTYGEKDLAILEQWLANPIGDVNIEDDDDLPELYWLLKHKQLKLAKKILASERLETFIQFICRKFNEYYSSELTNSERFHALERLSSAVREILSEFVLFLTHSDQVDPNITNIKKLLLNKYFGVDACHTPIKQEIDILNLIRKSDEFDKAIMLRLAFDFDEEISEIIDSGEFDADIDINLLPDQSDNIVREIIDSGASDQAIEPMLGLNSDPQKALKDFIEGIYKEYSNCKN